MAIALQGEVVVDGFYTSASSFVVTLPIGMTIGEVVVLDCIVGDLAKTFSATGWTVLHIGMSTSNRELIWRLIDGTEGTTVTVNVSTGTSSAHFSSFRLSGIDTTDPFNSDNSAYALSALTTTPSFAANFLTLDSGNGCLTHLSCEATRTVTGYDVGLLDEFVMSPGNISNHVYFDASIAGFGNPQYDFTLSDSRTYDMVLVELKTESDPSITCETGTTSLIGYNANLTIAAESEAGNAWFNSINWASPSFGALPWWNSAAAVLLQCNTGTTTSIGYPAILLKGGDLITLTAETGTTSLIGYDATFTITTPESVTEGGGGPDKSDSETNIDIYYANLKALELVINKYYELH